MPLRHPPDAFRGIESASGAATPGKQIPAAESSSLGLATTRDGEVRYLRLMHHSHEAGLNFSQSTGLGAANRLVSQREFRLFG